MAKKKTAHTSRIREAVDFAGDVAEEGRDEVKKFVKKEYGVVKSALGKAAVAVAGGVEKAGKKAGKAASKAVDKKAPAKKRAAPAKRRGRKNR